MQTSRGLKCCESSSETHVSYYSYKMIYLASLRRTISQSHSVTASGSPHHIPLCTVEQWQFLDWKCTIGNKIHNILHVKSVGNHRVMNQYICHINSLLYYIFIHYYCLEVYIRTGLSYMIMVMHFIKTHQCPWSFSLQICLRTRIPPGSLPGTQGFQPGRGHCSSSLPCRVCGVTSQITSVNLW